MVKTIKIDRKNNFFIDYSNGNSVETRYDPSNPYLHLQITLDDGSILTVTPENIKQEYGGQIVVQYNDDKFIIDDGYQDVLIRAGYIVYKDFDSVKEPDKDKGVEIRTNIINSIREFLSTMSDKVEICGNETKYILDTDNFCYTFNFDTINNMVNKNQQRKNNSLAYYPFSKDMDKFGTIYLSTFARKKVKLNEEQSKFKYKFADDVIKQIISELGPDFHYVGQPIKRRVLASKGI